MTAPDFYTLMFTSLFAVMWVGWFVVWRIMARRVKEAQQFEDLPSRLAHIVPILIAGALLLPLPFPSLLSQRFVPHAFWPAVLGALVTFAGLVICVWARFTIAGNWSSDVQVKHDHELIVTGPYRWVRHPIYTGLLLMFAGSALGVAEWRGVLAVAIVLASFWRKLRIEETAMRDTFGAAYDRYAERTRALIPFVI